MVIYTYDEFITEGHVLLMGGAYTVTDAMC